MCRPPTPLAQPLRALGPWGRHALRLLGRRSSPLSGQCCGPPCQCRMPWLWGTGRAKGSFGVQKRGAMMSGFERTSMILTSCQTYSVQCSGVVLPYCHCSANQTSAENVALSSPHGCSYRMLLGLSGSAHGAG